MASKVAVIGAGLSGLACALELKKSDVSVEVFEASDRVGGRVKTCLLYTSPSPRDQRGSRMPSSA